jgi:hypothetical protein
MDFAGISPSPETYERLVWSWAQSSRSDGPMKAYEALQSMQVAGMQPPLAAYESVLQAFTRGAAGEYLDLATDIMAALSTDGRSSDDNAGTETEVAVFDLETASKSRGPSKACYDSFVALWANSGRDNAPEVPQT